MKILATSAALSVVLATGVAGRCRGFTERQAR